MTPKINENTTLINIKTILLLWLLQVLRCYGDLTTELKSFHGNSAWEIVERSKYGILEIVFFKVISVIIFVTDLHFQTASITATNAKTH